MSIAPDIHAEMAILALFNLDTSLEGIKAHKNADPNHAAAIRRLYDKGLITQTDGGYLTDLGRVCAEHVQASLQILQP